MLSHKVRKTIRDHGLLQTGEKVLIACSGGADSVCLLLMLMELRAEGRWELSVGHFNHRLRREAQKDELFVRSLARKHSLEFFSASRDVKAFASEHGLNLEEAGRELRYDFLKRTASRIGAGKIATGHTLNDQAETFLMRLLRGSGRKGLGGIAPIRNGEIIRPLLLCERDEIEAYLTEKRVEFHEDKSNRDRRYLRNRIRWELLPVLIKDYEPHLLARIGRLTELLRSEEALLGSLVSRVEAETLLGEGERSRLDTRSLAQQPVALQRRLIRRFLERIRGDLRGITFEDVETVRGLKEGKVFSLEEGLALKRTRGIVGRRPDPLPILSYAYSWDGIRSLTIPDLRLVFRGITEKRSGTGFYVSDNDSEAVLDAGLLEFPLLVRSRREGDRYRPLGAPGRAKLKEIFRAKGIRVEERDRHPVFVSGEEIVWVQGLPVAHKFRITESTNAVFKIQVSSLPSSTNLP